MMNHDGTNVKKLTQNKRCTNLMVYDNWVYYIDITNFYGLHGKLLLKKFNLMNLKQEQTLAEYCHSFFIFDNLLFIGIDDDSNISKTGYYKMDLINDCISPVLSKN